MLVVGLNTVQAYKDLADSGDDGGEYLHTEGNTYYVYCSVKVYRGYPIYFRFGPICYCYLGLAPNNPCFPAIRGDTQHNQHNNAQSILAIVFDAQP